MRHWLLVLPMILVPLLAGCLDTSLDPALLDAVGDGVSEGRAGDGTGPFDVMDVRGLDAPDDIVGDLGEGVVEDVLHDSTDLLDVEVDIPEVQSDVPEVVPQVLGLFVAPTVFSGESKSANWTLRAMGPDGAPMGPGMTSDTWTLQGSVIGGTK